MGRPASDCRAWQCRNVRLGSSGTVSPALAYRAGVLDQQARLAHPADFSLDTAPHSCAYRDLLHGFLHRGAPAAPRSASGISDGPPRTGASAQESRGQRVSQRFGQRHVCGSGMHHRERAPPLSCGGIELEPQALEAPKRFWRSRSRHVLTRSPGPQLAQSAPSLGAKCSAPRTFF